MQCPPRWYLEVEVAAKMGREVCWEPGCTWGCWAPVAGRGVGAFRGGGSPRGAVQGAEETAQRREEGELCKPPVTSTWKASS